MFKKMFFSATCFCILASGCASYKPNAMPSASIDKMKFQQTQGNVTVAVDPYYNPVKTQGVFDNDFKDHELLALSCMFSTSESSHYLLKKSEIIVKDPNGRTFAPVGGKTAGDMAGRGYGYTVLWFFATGIGAIPSAIHTANINADIENDLIKMELPDVVDVKGQTHGLVYFNMHKYGEASAPREMEADFKLENPDTHELLNFAVKFEPNAGW